MDLPVQHRQVELDGVWRCFAVPMQIQSKGFEREGNLEACRSYVDEILEGVFGSFF